MTLQDRIESAMRDAMRARDERRTQTLRMAMSAAHNRKIELGRPLADEDYVEILGRQVKQRRESIEAFRTGGRDAMATNEEAEAAILAEFLPEPLSAGELEEIVRAAIAETGATSCDACWRPDRCSFHARLHRPRVRDRAPGRAPRSSAGSSPSRSSSC
jgi:uncharacterized protein YqeY